MTKIFYTLKNDAVDYVQTFTDGGLKLSAMPKTDDTEPPAMAGGDSGSSGCDAGMGGAVLLLCGTLAAVRTARRR